MTSSTALNKSLNEFFAQSKSPIPDNARHLLATAFIWGASTVLEEMSLAPERGQDRATLGIVLSMEAFYLALELKAQEDKNNN